MSPDAAAPPAPVVRDLDDLLSASRASEGFKAAVRDLRDGKSNPAIAHNPAAPRVKVLRLVSMLLEKFPEEPFESLSVDGHSGCSDFVGRAVARPGDVAYRFEWDCKWRAETLGWNDAFGDPDQIRAAREFGYQCFRTLERA